MTLTTESVSQPPVPAPSQAWLEVPLLYAPPGMNPEKEKEFLKAKYPAFKEGKQIRVPDDVIDAFLLLTAAAKHFDSQNGQAALAKNLMRRYMKDAQFAVDGDGHEVASRRFTDKTGYWTDPRTDDSIVKARGR